MPSKMQILEYFISHLFFYEFLWNFSKQLKFTFSNNFSTNFIFSKIKKKISIIYYFIETELPIAGSIPESTIH